MGHEGGHSAFSDPDPSEEQKVPRVLVVGAREGSLGAAVAEHVGRAGVQALTAGIAGEEMWLDASVPGLLLEAFEHWRPTHVVCTVGLNQPRAVYHESWRSTADLLMDVNYMTPMQVMNTFHEWLAGMPGVYVAISSNSAHIARSQSAAYCASKAALSMGIRAAARDFSRAPGHFCCWVYEPGALLGTPMTNAIRSSLSKDISMSRMLTNPEGLPTEAVARMIARDLFENPLILHGCAVRLDNGEQ